MAQNRSGFTLIEMLIATVIIGLLAAIAIPKFANSKEKAFDAVAIADLRNAITAAEAYYADNFSYPSAISDMDFTPSEGIVFTQFDLDTRKGMGKGNNGVEGLHIHVEHVNSTHYFHTRYPADEQFEKRNK